jgi:hypothetical protein
MGIAGQFINEQVDGICGTYDRNNGSAPEEGRSGIVV